MAPDARTDPNSVYIGADPDGCDYVVDQSTVSRRHCRLLYDQGGGSWRVEDLGSSNGTLVHGRRLGLGESTEIGFGDVIGLGSGYEFAFSREVVVKVTQSAPPQPGTPLDRALRQSSGGGLQGMRLDSSRRHDSYAEEGPAPTLQTKMRKKVDRGFTEDDISDSRRSEDPLRPAASISLGYDQANDVEVLDPAVSGRHARIRYDDGDCWVEDQGSTNGTWVSGERVRSARVQIGDTIGLGSRSVRFEPWMLELLQERSRRATAQSPAVGGEVKIGRDLDWADIVLEPEMVSREQCVARSLPGGGWHIQDLGSANGTFLNSRDNRIQAAQAGPDDVLYFGSYRFPLARLEALALEARPITGQSAIPAGMDEFIVGRDPDVAQVVVDHPQVSREHVRIKLLGDGRIEVHELGSTNGTFVDGTRLRGSTTVAATASISLGSYRFQLDVARGMVRRDGQGEITLQAQGVTVEVPDSESGQPIRLLDNIGFTVFPTEFVGLMGPSGAGKTTLLQALNGYSRPNDGQSLVNRKDLYGHYDEFRDTIGYVPQDDIVFPELTVYESLRFTAELRLPSDTSSAEIDQRIDDILRELEIDDRRDTIIGDALRKGISGGQRKRVNLAQELLTEPSLLFLDEPTSGLASEDTVNVMRMLRGLSDSGKTIILTIHQPSLEAYRMMDNIIYLFRGRLVYYGPSYPDSITFFNPDVPEGAAKQKLLADPGNALKPLAEDQRQAYASENPSGAIDAAITRRVRSYEAHDLHTEYVQDRARGTPQGEAAQASRSKVRPNPLRQWGILARRSALIKRKDLAATALLIGQAPIIAGLLLLVYGGRIGDGLFFDTLRDAPSSLFLLVAAAVWFGCQNAAREIVAERAIYRRERMVNLLIPSYVLSKFAVLGALCAIQCLLLLVVVYGPLDYSGPFHEMYAVLLLSSLAGVGMGLVVSAAARSGVQAATLIPLVLIPQIILGAAIMPLWRVPESARWVSQAMVSRWGYEALLHIEFPDKEGAYIQEVRSRCRVDDCHWGELPGQPDPIYYAADGAKRIRPGPRAQQIPAPDEDVNDDRACAVLCRSLWKGKPISPLERSFGADPDARLRVTASSDVPNSAKEPYLRPGAHHRTDKQTAYGVLAGFNLFLLLMVMAVLKWWKP